MAALDTVAAKAIQLPPGQPVKGRSVGRRMLKAWPQYLAISPFYALFLVFGAAPIAFSLYLSFHSWNGLGSITFVGLKQYAFLISDSTFYLALRNTLVIFVISTVPMLSFALVIAFMLNSAKRFSTFYRVAYFIPNVTSVVAMAILFTSIFGNQFGIINAALNVFGIGNVGWLSSPFGLKVVIAALMAWQYTGYNAIIYLAGMQAISGEVYEAARMDGAGAVSIFFRITIPLLRPIILFTVIMSTIGGLQGFTEAQIISTSSSTSVSGGVGQGGLTLMLYFYNQAFGNNNFGYGAAIAWGVFIIITLFTALNWQLARSKDK